MSRVAPKVNVRPTNGGGASPHHLHHLRHKHHHHHPVGELRVALHWHPLTCWNKNKDLFRVIITLAGYVGIGCLFFPIHELKTVIIDGQEEDVPWTFVDVLYFSVCTITTVGYGDLYPRTDGGMVFTIFYQFLGVVIAAAALFRLATSIIQFEKKIGKILVNLTLKKALHSARHMHSHSGSSNKSLFAASTAAMRVKDEVVHEAHLLQMQIRRITHTTAAVYIKAIIRIMFPMVAFILLGLVLGEIENWDYLTSIYGACVTVTGVGYGDVAPSSQEGRMFAIVYIPIGIVVTLNAVSNLCMFWAQRSQVNNYSPKNWMEMDKNHDGKVSSEEFVLHMLVTMGKIDRDTLDLLQEQFTILSHGKNNVDIKEITKLARIL